MADTEQACRGWYRLEVVLPGERVPDWVHVGRVYEGVRNPQTPGEVELLAEDGELSVLVAARLLTELPGPRQ